MAFRSHFIKPPLSRSLRWWGRHHSGREKRWKKWWVKLKICYFTGKARGRTVSLASLARCTVYLAVQLGWRISFLDDQSSEISQTLVLHCTAGWGFSVCYWVNEAAPLCLVLVFDSTVPAMSHLACFFCFYSRWIEYFLMCAGSVLSFPLFSLLHFWCVWIHHTKSSNHPISLPLLQFPP